jgi:hypothetical protein
MRLSAMPSRPTSVRGSVVRTRCERSPPAIAAAVCPMRSSGSSPTRTTSQAKTPSSARTPAITRPSTSSSRFRVWSVAVSDTATTAVAPVAPTDVASTR